MRIVTFGEIMMRLTPSEGDRLVSSHHFEAFYGGGEANVAESLAILGMDAAYITKLPKNPLGEAARNALRRYGVDTNGIVWGGERLGIYYLESGADRRPTRVVYDRKGSAIATASPEEFDWERLFQNADYFHISGITPALSDNMKKASLDALKKAKEMGLTTSFDPNYRAALWTKDEARETLATLLDYVDILITNEDQAKDLLGVSTPEEEIEGDNVSEKGYRLLAERLFETYSLKTVALTERRTFSANDNSICAKLYDGKDFVSSVKYRMDIVDRVGGGDAFAAGLLYALANGYALQEAVDFAAAACCLKHSIKGDVNLATKEEISALAKGNMNGRTKR